MTAHVPPPMPLPATAARERPRRLDTVETVFQTALLSFRRSLRGGRLVTAVVLVLLPLVLSIPVAQWGKVRNQEKFFYDMLGYYHFGIAVPAVALAFATAFPWPEAEEGTLTYWFTAPVRRWTIHLGRYLAAAVIGCAALPISVAAIVLPLNAAPEAALGDVSVAAVGATLLAYPAYLALFWLIATVWRRGLVAGVIFVVAENGVAVSSTNLVNATLVHYVRSIIKPSMPSGSRYTAAKFLHAADTVPMTTAVLVFVLVLVVALVLSLLLVEWIEYRGKTSQAS